MQEFSAKLSHRDSGRKMMEDSSLAFDENNIPRRLFGQLTEYQTSDEPPAYEFPPAGSSFENDSIADKAVRIDLFNGNVHTLRPA